MTLTKMQGVLGLFILLVIILITNPGFYNNMYNSILLGVKQKKFNKYSEAFNFFQSKSVNSIIASRKLEYVIHFRDL